jgi:hypothetical protein
MVRADRQGLPACRRAYAARGSWGLKLEKACGGPAAFRHEVAWPWYQNGTGQVGASERGFLDMAGRDVDLPLREVLIRFRVT